MLFINEETDNVNLYESDFVSIESDSSLRVTKILVDWCEGDPYLELICENCSGFNFEIAKDPDPHYENFCGQLEITGFSYLKTKEGYIVQINFDRVNIGFIQLKCSKFFINTPEEPKTEGGNSHRIIGDEKYTTEWF